MNNLSWMIYFAELSGSVSGFLTFLTIVAGTLTMVGTICFCITSTDPNCWSWEDRDLKMILHNRAHGMLAKMLPRAAAALLVFGLAATVLPSKETVYAITASEMGEQLISSPTAGKALKALDAWLDRQISSPADSKAE